MRVLPGTYRDSESNLVLNGVRYFDPKLWRFLTPDSMSIAEHVTKWKAMTGMPGQPPLEGNSYVRAANNPLRWTDPTGLDVNVCFYPNGVTHVGFGVSGESGTSGYYPKYHFPNSPGEVRKDPKNEPKQCKTIPSSKDEDNCMLKCRLKRANDPGWYHLIQRQCTGFVRECMVECGILSKDQPSGNPGQGPWPSDFYRNLPGLSDSIPSP